MMNTKRFYTYMLIDPRTQLPFYVGKGSGNRYLSHITEAYLPLEKQSNIEKCKIINDILKVGLTIQYRRYWFSTADEAYTYERKVIKKWGRKKDGTGILTNLLPGGKGGASQLVYVFCKHTGDFVGLYLSQSEAANKLAILESSISACLNNNAQTAGEYMFSRSNEAPRLGQERRIEILELPTLKSLGTFGSSYDAASFIGVNQTLVHNCLSGKQPKIRRKFVVRYMGAAISPQHIIVQYSGTLRLQEFASLKEAADSISIDRSSILRCFRKPEATAGGFTWKKEVRL